MGIGKFGHKVIGTEQAAAEQEAVEEGVVKFGPRVIGEEYNRATTKLERAKRAAAGETIEVPAVKDLDAFLDELENPQTIRKLMSQDDRVTAEPKYQRRLRELEGPSEPAGEAETSTSETETDDTSSDAENGSESDEEPTEPQGEGEPSEDGDAQESGDEGGDSEPEPSSSDPTTAMDTMTAAIRKGEDAATEAYVSIEELESFLATNPETLPGLLEAEVNRVGGPRKGALRTLLSYEQERDGGPRDEILQKIEAHL